jgi:hypothetical protein
MTYLTLVKTAIDHYQQLDHQTRCYSGFQSHGVRPLVPMPYAPRKVSAVLQGGGVNDYARGVATIGRFPQKFPQRMSKF